ncbi:MAG: hypothetical protein MHM6MM_000109 [Cercozoa sp. M6MM]
MSASIFDPPKRPRVPVQAADKEQTPRLYIVLTNAGLETVKSKKGYELLRHDQHKGILSKHSRDPQKYRPDIVHQTLLALSDSPLNQAGKLQIYIHTVNNVLIEVSPHCRIPPTFDRFCMLMVQLLHRMKIKATGGNNSDPTAQKTLLKVVKSPVTRHLPAAARRFFVAASLQQEEELTKLPAFAQEHATNTPVCVSIDCTAKVSTSGDAPEWTEGALQVSHYELAPSTLCTRVCTAFELHWDVL